MYILHLALKKNAKAAIAYTDLTKARKLSKVTQNVADAVKGQNAEAKQRTLIGNPMMEVEPL